MELEARNLSPMDVVRTLQAQSVFIPTGNAKFGDIDYQIISNAMPEAVEELNDIPIKTADGAVVFMRDIGHVEDSHQIQSNKVRINGKAMAYIPIYRQPGANTLEIVDSINAKLERINARLREMDPKAKDLVLGVVMDQSATVRSGVKWLQVSAVLGAVLIAARLKLPVNIHVVVPAAENMPDGLAIKPADVLTMANGKTVEVLNTDAEGRLVLADGLWYAGKDNPDHIIDAATLTGACVIALGNHFAGVMGNSSELMDALSQAGGETHERVWPLPLVDEFKEEVKGTWSDLKNLGNGREAGAETAAAFLSNFVAEDTSWAHVDIAGPSHTTAAQPTCPKGGTGFGARLLARTMQILVS